MAALRVGMPALPAALRAPARRRPSVASRRGASVRAGVRRAPAVPQTSVVEERVVAGTRVRGARSLGCSSARQPVAAARVSLRRFYCWRGPDARAFLARTVLADGTMVFSFGRVDTGRANGPGGAQEARAPALGTGEQKRPRVHFLGSPPPTLARIARAQVQCPPRERASTAKSAAAARREDHFWSAKGRCNCRARLTAAAAPSRRIAGLGSVSLQC